MCCLHDQLSFFAGLASILAWGVAEIPQIYANFSTGKSEGVSALFICAWLGGDTLNICGCILSKALPTQLYTAIVYTSATVILLLQHIWYSRTAEDLPEEEYLGEDLFDDLSKRSDAHPFAVPTRSTMASETFIRSVESERALVSPHDFMIGSPLPVPSSLRSCSHSFIGSFQSNGGSFRTSIPSPSRADMHSGPAPRRTNSLDEARDPPSDQDSTDHQPDSRQPLLGSSLPAPRRLLSIPLVLMITLRGGGLWASGPPLGTSRGMRGFMLGDSVETMGPGRHLLAGDVDDAMIGTILGWAMTVIYLSSRLPQIVMNVKRGSVEGLSPTMFILAVTGNATYLASILLRSTAPSKLVPNLPWIVDAILCIFLDMVILFQFLLYKWRVQRHSHDTEEPDQGYTPLKVPLS